MSIRECSICHSNWVEVPPESRLNPIVVPICKACEGVPQTPKREPPTGLPERKEPPTQ